MASLQTLPQYQSEWAPDVSVDPIFPQFLEKFYALSDEPKVSAEAYADNFTDNAILIIGKKKAVGRSEIIALRRTMWDEISARSHRPIQVFPFGPLSREVMLFGTVEYVTKDSRTSTVEWSARAIFEKNAGAVKMEFYQVYL